MSLSAKRESLTRIHGRYQRAGRPHKTRILDEFCATCGYHRKAALRRLNRSLPTAPPKRSGPKITDDPVQVLPGLKAVWLASDQLCSKRLQAAPPEGLAHYERCPRHADQPRGKGGLCPRWEKISVLRTPSPSLFHFAPQIRFAPL